MATFAEEFKKQRAMKGSGKTFEYKGKTYSTDTADGKKAEPTKPASRPAGLNPKSGASSSTAGKVSPKMDMPARPAGGAKAKQAAKMGATSSNVASNKAAAQRKADAAPKPASMGSRIMDASANAGAYLGKKAADAANALANYGKDKPKPRVGTTTNYKAGGMIKEGSAKDMREDKAMAKKAGLTMKQHEASAADVKHDKPSKMKTGGGVMRGAGAATRGKKFSGSF